MEQSYEVSSDKELEAVVSPSLVQSLVCSTSSANCSLEMMDASNAMWQDNEGLEMGDSSCLLVVCKDSTKSWDNTRLAVDKFLIGWVITCYALHSLCLYVKFQDEFQFATIGFNTSMTPLLQKFGKKESSCDEDILKQEGKESQLK